MANSLLTISMITRKALQLFRNSNAFLQAIDRQYDSSFAKSGAKIGNQLRIRLPNDYTVRTGQTAVPQNTTENSVLLTLATMKGVDTSFSSTELSLSMDDFAVRVLAPMVNTLAGAVAADVMNVVESTPNLVHNVDGANNTISPVAATWLQAGAVLDLNEAPRGDRVIISDPVSMSRTVAGLAGLFNAQDKIASQYKKGLIGMDVLGYDWMMDQLSIVHQAGTFATGTVNGTANQTGNSIGVTATTGTLNTGDIITFQGVNGVNKVVKTSTGVLQQFVITIPAPAGSTVLNVYPALNPSVGGLPVANQTVTASPTPGAAIAAVIKASEVYRKNFAFCPLAFTMVTADLELPTKAVIAADRQSYDGISLRMIQDYNSTTDFWLTRLDILYGYAAIRPEWSVIIADSV